MVEHYILLSIVKFYEINWTMQNLATKKGIWSDKLYLAPICGYKKMFYYGDYYTSQILWSSIVYVVDNVEYFI